MPNGKAGDYWNTKSAECLEKDGLHRACIVNRAAHEAAYSHTTESDERPRSEELVEAAIDAIGGLVDVLQQENPASAHELIRGSRECRQDG